MDFSADENMLNEFVAEGRDHLDAIEPDLLAMDSNGADVSPEIINHVFRAVHSIKGSAGFLGIQSITRLGHVMENVLMQMRDGTMPPTPEKIDALLACLDKLRLMIDDVHGCDQVSFEEEIARLDEIQSAEKVLAGSPKGRKDETPIKSMSSIRPEFEGQDPVGVFLDLKGPPGFGDVAYILKREALEQVIEEDLTLQAVWVQTVEDIHKHGRSIEDFLSLVDTLGTVLASDIEGVSTAGSVRKPPADGIEHVLIATIVEEPDLAGGILEVPEEQVLTINAESIQKLLDESGPRGGLTAPPAEKPKPPVYHPPTPPVVAEKEKKKKEPAVKPSTPRLAEGPPGVVKGPITETIRVSVDLIDRMMNLAGELVLGRNQLSRLLENTAERISGLSSVLQNVDLVTADIQEQVMQLRMQPVSNIFNKFPRVVRDMSRQLSKEVELVMEGAEVELDKSILEALSDPLTHLIRNSLDHAIESPEDRVALGKPRSGLVTLLAFHEEGQVNITVSDDGRGIDPKKVAGKAVETGLVDFEAASKMSDTEKMALVFLPGFSTAETISDVSGRGVGMDVVRTNIENIGGRLEVDSVIGQGTTFRLRLPLTLAIIPSLVVMSGGQYFAIPQMDVQELVCIQAGDASQRIEKVGEASVLRLRGRLLPLIRLTNVLGLEKKFIHPITGQEMSDRRERIVDRRLENKSSLETESEKEERERRRRERDRRQLRAGDIFAVVLRVGPNRYGLLVDELLNTEEIVVKPLPNQIKECRHFSGTTIMGDGSVAMILSAGGIAHMAALRFGEVGAEERRRQEEARRREARAKPKQSIILFNNAPEEFFALPLASVARLEKIDPRTIHRIGNREFITYREAGLPLIRLEHFLPVSPSPGGNNEIYLIVPRTDKAPAGIVASKIVDAIETDTDVEPGSIKRPGLAGSAVVDGRVTLFLEATELLQVHAKAVGDFQVDHVTLREK